MALTIEVDVDVWVGIERCWRYEYGLTGLEKELRTWKDISASVRCGMDRLAKSRFKKNG